MDVAGNAGAVLFWQSGPIALNDGTICASTVMLSVVVIAHCPAAGVKVYTVVPAVDVLIVAGLHVPLMPLVEVAGNDGAPEFWQSGPIALNVGVTGAVITMVIVVVVPHWPPFGVNVYVVLPAIEVLMVAGLHVPLIPLVDVAGSEGAVLFWQSGPICVNAGVICEVITTSIVVVMPHCPVFGVNVYVVVPIVDVLIVAGLHVPLIPFNEVEGNVGAVLFWQSGPICVNVGVICVEITMLMVVVAAHCPAAGVNVYVVVPVAEVLIVAGLHVPVMPLFDVAGKVGAVLF